MNDVFPPAVEPALREWHRIVASGDLAALPALLHPDVVFRSPAAFRPYRGAPTVALILRTVFGVFSGFAYERQFAAGRLPPHVEAHQENRRHGGQHTGRQYRQLDERELVVAFPPPGHRSDSWDPPLHALGGADADEVKRAAND